MLGCHEKRGAVSGELSRAGVEVPIRREAEGEELAIMADNFRPRQEKREALRKVVLLTMRYLN